MKVRPPLPTDRGFVLREVERLADFDLPPWRGKPEIYEVERPTLARAFDVPAGAEGLLVAEGAIAELSNDGTGASRVAALRRGEVGRPLASVAGSARVRFS